VPAAFLTETNQSTSVLIPTGAPTDQQTNKIFEDSIMLGKSRGYTIIEETKEDGYLLQEKKTQNGGYIKLTVHISNFFTIGPAVQVYGKVTGGDEDKVSSGVSADVEKLKNKINEILSVK
jgi:hypothetical protein